MFIDTRSSRGSLIFWACCDSVGLVSTMGQVLAGTFARLVGWWSSSASSSSWRAWMLTGSYRRILGLVSNVKRTVNYWQETCIQSPCKWFMMIVSLVKIPRSNLIFLLGQIVKMSGSALNVLTFSVYFQSAKGCLELAGWGQAPWHLVELAVRWIGRATMRAGILVFKMKCVMKIYVRQVQHCKITSLSLPLSPWCN